MCSRRGRSRCWLGPGYLDLRLTRRRNLNLPALMRGDHDTRSTAAGTNRWRVSRDRDLPCRDDRCGDTGSIEPAGDRSCVSHRTRDHHQQRRLGRIGILFRRYAALHRRIAGILCRYAPSLYFVCTQRSPAARLPEMATFDAPSCSARTGAGPSRRRLALDHPKLRDKQPRNSAAAAYRGVILSPPSGVAGTSCLSTPANVS